MRPAAAQDAGKKQVMAMMGIQTTRASTVARPFMRLLPQKLTVQVPGSDTESEVSGRTRLIAAMLVASGKSSSGTVATMTLRPHLSFTKQ